MGKGGSSSSNTTTNTKNTTGQNAIQGDNLGVALSGVSDSQINVSMSDHGAIEAAKEMGELALNNTKDIASSAIDKTARMSEAALDSNTKVTQSALSMGENLAEDAINLSRENSEVMANAHSENLQYIAGLAGSQAKQNSDNLKAMTQLAKTNSNGGSADTNATVLKLVGVLAGAAAIVAVAKAVGA